MISKRTQSRSGTTLRTAVAAVVLAVAGLVLLSADTAFAQRDNSGGFFRSPSPYGRSQKSFEAGKFDYYVLALSWSPSYCAGLPRDSYDPQCNRRDGKRYSFVLHGLWPQFDRGWPHDCATADRGFVPRSVANRMLDIMPSDKLVFHEYRKHGVCSGLGVEGYFDLARSLYNKVKIPPRYMNFREQRAFVSSQDLIAEFVAANPGLKPDSIAIDCGGAGPRLRDVHICFDKGGNFHSCGRNENQSKMCPAPRFYLPPVRDSGATQPNLAPAVGQKI